eukprot:356244-Chlamydomonas_euryale.AAC.4
MGREEEEGKRVGAMPQPRRQARRRAKISRLYTKRLDAPDARAEEECSRPSAASAVWASCRAISRDVDGWASATATSDKNVRNCLIAVERGIEDDS